MIVYLEHYAEHVNVQCQQSLCFISIKEVSGFSEGYAL
jgi:hypothetical protein